MSRYRISALAAALLVPVLTAPTAPQAKKAVAVLRFDNETGDERFDNLGRALSSMMISDLSAVEEIQLVERERLEEVVAELDLQQSGYVDKSSAVSVGMITGAQYVVTGAFQTVDPEMRLDTRVVSVESTEIVKTAEVIGMKDQLFDLQQRLADELIDGLAVVLTEEDRERLREQQEANRIDDVETALAFSRALCLADYGAYAEAFEQMQEVRQAAPGSRLVGVTVQHLKDQMEAEAKRQAVNRAGRAIGGLLGRRNAPRQAERPRPSC